MNHQYQDTHTIRGQHKHHMLSHRPYNKTQEHHKHISQTKKDQNKEDNMGTLHTKQLDYLFTQLDILEMNMEDKQPGLAKVSRNTWVSQHSKYEYI